MTSVYTVMDQGKESVDLAERIGRADAAIIVDSYDRLRRFAAVVAPWDMDPDDVLHSALAAALHRTRLDELGNPLAYMRTAIVNHVRSELRRKHNRRRLAVRLRAEQPTTATASYPSDLADLMHLRPVERAVLYLHDIERMPFDEVAEATGIAVGHARVTASRARRRLRTLLEEEA